MKIIFIVPNSKIRCYFSSNYVSLDAFYFQFRLFQIKIITLGQSSRENLKIGQQSTTSNAFIIVFGHFRW